MQHAAFRHANRAGAHRQLMSHILRTLAIDDDARKLARSVLQTPIEST